MREVDVSAGGVHDEQEVIPAVGCHEVIDHPTVGVGEQAISHVLRLESAHGGRRSPLEGFTWVVASDFNHAHVGDIEQACCLATPCVFGDDPLVLDREFPASKVDQAPAKLTMELDQCCRGGGRFRIGLR